MRIKTFPLSLAALCAAVAVSTANGQRPGARNAAFEVDYSGRSELSQGTPSVGNLSASRLSLSADYHSFRNTGIQLGASYRLRSFYHNGTGPIPERLHGISMPVTFSRRWSKWMVAVRANPGLFSDMEDIGTGDFNAPVMVTSAYSYSPRLDLLFGLRFDLRNEIPVVGGPGLRWRIDDRWHLNLFFPRPALVWRASDSLSFSAGGEFTGGSYRVGERFGRDHGMPQLDDTQISYREIRATLGCSWTVRRGSVIRLNTGAMINRRVAFDDRDLQLDGDLAPFVSLRWMTAF